jgi:hypothetical protein
MSHAARHRERILVLEQNKSGQSKIQGILERAAPDFSISRYEITTSLPPILDETALYLPTALEADLVLDYLKHPDLSLDVARTCREKGIPVVASGRRMLQDWAWTPPVCCALPKSARCGLYSRMFGYPEFEVTLAGDSIRDIVVKRGAPCGATWKSVAELRGTPCREAIEKVGLRVQFACTADPAGWDPIKGKSPVHLAADIHSAALRLAVIKAGRNGHP